MKIIVLFTLLFSVIHEISLAQDLNVITFNIRYDNPDDGINAWPNRIGMVTGLLKFHEPGIFGVQEAQYHQLKDIEKEMPDFKWIGTGRDDGDKAGEFSAIFYNKQLFMLIKDGQFWLSETPDKPGFGWDAACYRVCTWGKFIQKETNKKFFVFNTHFDHKGDTARANSAILIRNFIAKKTYKESLPVILTGDFNLTPDMLPISHIKKDLSDTRDVSIEPPYGPVGTFNRFQHDSPLDKRIDYIFVSRGVKVFKYGVLTDTKENRYPSDHLPVFVKIILK